MGHSRKSGINRNGSAAQKISVAQFSGLSERQIGDRLRGLDHEEVVIIVNNAAVDAYSGNEFGLDFSKEQIEEIKANYPGAEIIHNHPRGAEKFGGTLTASDISFMLKVNASSVTSVSGDKGKGNFTLKATEHANPKGLKVYLKANKSAIVNEYETVYGIAFDRVKSKGKTKSQADRHAQKSASGYLHKKWKKAVNQYGYEYTAWNHRR